MRLPRIRMAPALLAGFVWFAAIALSAWILAGWYWRLKAPAAIAAAPSEITDPVAAAKLVGARHLFGQAQQAGSAAPVVVSRYTLLGVAADKAAAASFAVIAEEGKAGEGYILGDEIAPGMRLVAIRPDAVELEHNGQREIVRLSEKPAAGAPPLSANPSLSSPQTLLNSQTRAAQRNIGMQAAQQPIPLPQPQAQQPPEPQANNQPTQ